MDAMYEREIKRVRAIQTDRDRDRQTERLRG